MDLGSPPLRTFWKITLPIITPGVVAAFLLSLALSIDDYIITSFVAGPTITFPRRVFDSARVALPPQVHVLATIIMLAAIFIIVRGHRRGQPPTAPKRADGRSTNLAADMPRPRPPRIAVAPDGGPGLDGRGGRGGRRPRRAAGRGRGLIWGDPHAPDGLREALDQATHVALGAAAVRRHRALPPRARRRPHVGVRQGRVRRAGRRAGAHARPRRAARAGHVRPGDVVGDAAGRATCSGGRVTILGGGGITESLVRLLEPFDCHITVVRRTVDDMDGVDDVLEADRYADALPGADLVVLALALTPETEGIIAADELALMERPRLARQRRPRRARRHRRPRRRRCATA